MSEFPTPSGASSAWNRRKKVRLALGVVGGVLALLIGAQVILVRMNRIVCTQAGFAVAQMERLLSGLEAYARANGGKYPDSLEALLELDSEGQPFLENAMSLPLDPWGNPYVYSPPLNGAEPRVISYGRDGKAGGDHQNADIDSGALQRNSSSAWE